MKKTAVVLIVALLLQSCGASYQLKHKLNKEKNSYFKGFTLYNPETKTNLVSYNADKYFLPASTTKLFTFYTAYTVLDDSLATFDIYENDKALILKPNAEPSLLYGIPNKSLAYLKQSKKQLYVLGGQHIDDAKFGSGWAWDDFEYDYQAEKSIFPVYGNLVTILRYNKGAYIKPAYFRGDLKDTTTVNYYRDLNKNTFYINSNRLKDSVQVPFVTSLSQSAFLLGEAINKMIFMKDSVAENTVFKPYKSVKAQGLYRKLLHKSDNFIAEQLLLMVSKKLDSGYATKPAIAYMLKEKLADLPQKPRWVDGSGLSRYNLFSPNDMVFLLAKMQEEIPQDYLFDVLKPITKLQGMKKTAKPYVYAKSGSMSNNRNLCGYVITKKGKILIFSIMNNHFKKKNSEINAEIGELLNFIHKKF